MTHRYVLAFIELEGFKSFQEKTLVEFDGKGGLKFLTGRNEVNPRMGANGAGKSSLWAALFWCQYGVDPLGERAGDLTSWGMKRPTVTVGYTVDEETLVHIRRQGSPERLFLCFSSYDSLGNFEPATQIEVDEALGLSRARFAQSVLFGQSVPFFLDITVPQRGALLDEALDLSVWTTASETAAAWSAKKNEAIATTRSAIEYAKGKLDGLPDKEELERESIAWREAREQEMEAAIRLVGEAEKRHDIAEKAYKAAQEAWKNAPKPDTTELNRLRDERRVKEGRLGEIRGEISAVAKRNNVFHMGTVVCPTCQQPITKDHANKYIHDQDMMTIDYEIETGQLKDAIDELDIQIKRAIQIGDAIQSRKNALEVKGQEARSTRLFATEEFARVTRDAEALADKGYRDDPYATQIATLEASAEIIKADIRDLQDKRLKLDGELLLIDYWKMGFKKVRLFIVKRIMAQLEIETANAASILGLTGWRIQFATETETKSGTLKQGVQIAIQSPESPTGVRVITSGGEGQRIRLAINMGLAGLIQRMAGVWYNVSIWDEPSGFLSDEGIEDLLECFGYVAKVTGKALWLTDHRTYAFNFDDVWTVVKDAKGSRIEKKEIEQ